MTKSKLCYETIKSTAMHNFWNHIWIIVTLNLVNLIRRYRQMALVLASMVLFSTIGISMNVHYCMGQMKNINLVGKAKSCHEMAMIAKSSHCKKVQTACHSGDQNNTTECKDGCCDQKNLSSKLDYDSTVHSYTLDAQKLKLFVSAYLSVFLIDADISHEQKAISDHRPPPLVRDIPILVQSFLL